MQILWENSAVLRTLALGASRRPRTRHRTYCGACGPSPSGLLSYNVPKRVLRARELDLFLDLGPHHKAERIAEPFRIGAGLLVRVPRIAVLFRATSSNSPEKVYPADDPEAIRSRYFQSAQPPTSCSPWRPVCGIGPREIELVAVLEQIVIVLVHRICQ